MIAVCADSSGALFMTGRKPNVFLWTLFGASFSAFAVGTYKSSILLKAGYALTTLPPLEMALEVMGLHRYAMYGAIAGFIIGMLEKWMYASAHRKSRLDAHPNPAPTFADDGPDEVIRKIREQRAEQYMATRKADEPTVENIITARGGLVTYKILAYRFLTDQEMKTVVATALQANEIEEPAPGREAVLMSDIGKL